MKKKSVPFCEALLVLLFFALLLLSQLIGSTSVVDPSLTADENGLPATGTKLEDLEAPGTKFGVLVVPEWEDEIRKRFPEGEIVHYHSMANLYTGRIVPHSR